jgi:DNA polymerase sigma
MKTWFQSLLSNGLTCTATARFPAIAPLTLVLKQYLKERSLHHAYTGGMSSHCLIMLVASFLQRREQEQSAGMVAGAGAGAGAGGAGAGVAVVGAVTAVTTGAAGAAGAAVDAGVVGAAAAAAAGLAAEAAGAAGAAGVAEALGAAGAAVAAAAAGGGGAARPIGAAAVKSKETGAESEKNSGGGNCLGRLLLDFLHFFGTVFDARRSYVSLRVGGAYPGRAEARIDLLDPLFIQDPLVGRGLLDSLISTSTFFNRPLIFYANDRSRNICVCIICADSTRRTRI